MPEQPIGFCKPWIEKMTNWESDPPNGGLFNEVSGTPMVSFESRPVRWPHPYGKRGND
jgi:hypothetical protein